MRRESMMLVILFTLNGKDSRDIVLLESLKVLSFFGVASHVNLRRYLREFEVVETTVIMNSDFCLLISDAYPLRVSLPLVLEVKDATRFPLTLNSFSLLDVVIAKLFPLPEGVERVGIYLIFFLS